MKVVNYTHNAQVKERQLHAAGTKHTFQLVFSLYMLEFNFEKQSHFFSQIK